MGYSLGGLVARYVVGLLFSSGTFEKLQPVNFHTFATPHVGTRTPLGPFPGSFGSAIFNALGPRTLSVSGRQMWMIDEFRDTGRPLLSVLADPGSIFMRGLKGFKNLALYANVINDRSVSFYTAMIWDKDPFRDLEDLDLNYLPGWEGLAIDPSDPISSSPKTPEIPQTYLQAMTSRSTTFIKNAPLMGAIALLVPIGSTVYLINSGIQVIRSSNRIKLHEAGKAGIELGRYRIPVMIGEARERIGRVLSRRGTMESKFAEDEGEEGSGEVENGWVMDDKEVEKKLNGHVALTDAQISNPNNRDNDAAAAAAPTTTEKSPSTLSNPLPPSPPSTTPQLSLLPPQIQIIQDLNTLPWRKFPVYIRKVRHTHAAIVVRMDRKAFDEGRRLMGHWKGEVWVD